MPRQIEPWEWEEMKLTGLLNYVVQHCSGTDKLSLTVQHDRGGVANGWSGAYSTGMELPAEWWAVVLPALVARMPANVARECLKRITERAGEVL